MQMLQQSVEHYLAIVLHFFGRIICQNKSNVEHVVLFMLRVILNIKEGQDTVFEVFSFKN